MHLSCHCERVRLVVRDTPTDLLQCNCSTCRRFGAIHWYVSSKSIELLSAPTSLTHYSPSAIGETHGFCPTCGSSILRTGYPDGVVALNACCIEEVDIFELDVKRFDGRCEMPPGVTR